MRVNLIDKDELLHFIRNSFRSSIHIECESDDINIAIPQAVLKTVDAVIEAIEMTPVKQTYLCSDCALYNKDWGWRNG